MELRINITSAAAILAEASVKSHYLITYPHLKDVPKIHLDDLMYELDKPSSSLASLTFRPEAMEIFKSEYDRIFDILLDAEVKTQEQKYDTSKDKNR